MGRPRKPTATPVTRADGSVVYRVRTRANGVHGSETFDSHAQARTFCANIVEFGDDEAVAMLNRSDRHHADYVPTTTEMLERYITQLTGVTDRTKDDYRSQQRRYLARYASVPVDVLTKRHIAAIVNEMDAAGLAPKTIRNAVHMLSSVLALAVDEGHILTNPCRGVRIPKARQFVDDDEEAEAKFLTYEEFGILLAQIPDYWRPLVVFLVGTGLRWSEATALNSRHVDLGAGTVRVRQAWKKKPPDREAGIKGGWTIGPPKSDKSRRTVNAAVQALAVAAPLLGPGKFIFTTHQGMPVQHSNFFNRVWKPAVIRASICAEHMDPGCRCGTTKPLTCPVHVEKDVRGRQVLPRPCGCVGTLAGRPGIHDLRHTHASWLIAEGKTLEQVQDQLGHESILTTRSVYGHLLPALGVETGKAASAALARVVALGATPLAALEE